MVEGEVVKTEVKGSCKWFSNSRGYGFLLSEEFGEDIFVHYSSILEDGYKMLKENQEVEFTVVRVGTGKLQAQDVKKL